MDDNDHDDDNDHRDDDDDHHHRDDDSDYDDDHDDGHGDDHDDDDNYDDHGDDDDDKHIGCMISFVHNIIYIYNIHIHSCSLRTPASLAALLRCLKRIGLIQKTNSSDYSGLLPWQL